MCDVCLCDIHCLCAYQDIDVFTVQDVVERVEDQVSSHEEYRKAYIACLDWLANTKHRLQRLSDYSGDKRCLQDRLQQLRVSAYLLIVKAQASCQLTALLRCGCVNHVHWIAERCLSKSCAFGSSVVPL